MRPRFSKGAIREKRFHPPAKWIDWASYRTRMFLNCCEKRTCS